MKQQLSRWVQQVAASPQGYRLLALLFRFGLTPIFAFKHHRPLFAHWSKSKSARKSGKKRVILGLAKPANFNFVRGLAKQLDQHPDIDLYFANLSQEVQDDAIAQVIGNKEVVPFGLLPLIPCDLFITPKSTLFWNYPNSGLRVHTFHSPVSLHQVYTEGSFQGFDAFFCNGPHQLAELSGVMKARRQQKYKAFEVGSEIIDAYYANRKPFEKLDTLVYGPSWGPTSSVRLLGKEIIAAVLGTGVHLIFRPHPVSYLHDEEAVDDILKTFSQHPRFEVFDIQKGGRIAPEADGLISDFSGVAFEFALGYEKPVFFVDVPQKIMNPNWQQYWPEPGIEMRYREKIGRLAFSPEMLADQVADVRACPENFQSTATRHYNELVFHRGEAVAHAVQSTLEILGLPFKKN
jgi:hypothetical protein